MTNWRRLCAEDISLLGSWAFTADDTWQGIADAISAARDMRCLKATIVPTPEIID